MSNLDLNDLLEGWPHEPGQVKARKIVGRDGNEKIQLRIDLGLIQMELNGRPDGIRPHGFESLLHYHQAKSAMVKSGDQAYVLSEPDIAALQQEGAQYYHRYLSLFQINDFHGVVRDTQRNLDLFDFVNAHTERDELSWTLQQFRPYVLMMNTRAKASIFLGQGKFSEAIGEIKRGRGAILEFFQRSNFPEMAAKSSEIHFLDDWLKEVGAKRPRSKIEIMESEMETAVAKEFYERAAELRDAINQLKKQSVVLPRVE